MLLRPRQTEFVNRAVAALRARGNTPAVAPTEAKVKRFSSPTYRRRFQAATAAGSNRPSLKR